MCATPTEAKPDSPLELRIVFDSSAIYTASAGNLLNGEISSLISNAVGDQHLRMSWYLPEIVVKERQHQIKAAALELRPSVAKFERTIRHTINITEEAMNARIDAAIEAQIAEHRLIVCRCDPGRIDWPALIENAVTRQPPFDPKNEKGFRDALILEAFRQLVSASPCEDGQCRIFLVTNDDRLAEAAELATKNAQNVRILRSADDVKGLINTLLSTLPENAVEELRANAKRYFFDQDSNSGIFKMLRVGKQIGETCSAQLAALPPGATRRENEAKWLLISGPSFVKKIRERVYWATKVKVRARAFQWNSPPDVYSRPSVFNADIPQSEGSTYTWVASGEDRTAELTAPPAFLVASGSTQVLPPGAASMALPPGSTFTIATSSQPVERLVAQGVTTVIVNWSVAVGAKGQFDDPRVEGIEFVATEWDHT